MSDREVTDNQDAEALSAQARERRQANDYDEALTLYDRALALDAGRVDDWINRGLTLWTLKRNEAALESFDRALKLDANSALAWMNRGNALSGLGRAAEALASYDRALEIDSHLANGWYNKGDELARAGRFIEAKACFENACGLGIPQAAAMADRCDQILMNDMYS